MNKSERCKLLDDDLQHALRKETFDALFAKTVNSHADRLALEFGGAELTYRQLEKRVEGLKRFLLSYLGNSSAPVCVFIERKAELAITMMGVLCSGHTYVPLDPLMPKGRLESLLELIQPKLILHVDPAPNYLREKWPLACLSEDMAHEEGGERCEPASGGPAYIASPYHREDLRATPVSTAGVLNLLFWTRQHHGIHFEDRIAATMRPGLDASLCEMLTALLSGASLHFPEESLIRNPTAFIKWLEEKKITRLHLPTALTELMLAEEWPKEHPLKTLFASGKQLTKKPDGVPFTLINRYGPAENGFFSFEAKVDPHDSELIIPIGSAVSNVRWAILDESLQEVEEGKAGQLALGGLALIDGYYHNEEESQRSFIVHTRLGRRPERLFLTGDRVRQRKDGLLEFLGRCRCSPTSGLVDLECLLGQHPGVKQVAAKNNSWGEVSVYWVKKPGIATTSRGLLNFLKGRLSPSRMPRQILELQNMPLDLCSKIHYAQLPESQRDEHEEVIPPRNGVEKKLIDICHEVLRKYPVSVRKCFHEMGLKPEEYLTLARLMEERLEKRVAVSTLYFHPSVELLAKELSKDPLPQPLIQPIRSGRKEHTVVCFSRSDGELYPFFHLAEALQADWNVVGIALPKVPPEDLDAFVNRCAEAILEDNPEGPYRLVGEGMGGSIAFAVASALVHLGKEVIHTSLVDAPCPFTTAPPSKRMQTFFAALKRSAEQTPKQFFIQKYQEYEVRLWHRLGLQHFADREITFEPRAECRSAWWRALRKKFKGDPRQIKQLLLFNLPVAADRTSPYDGWKEHAAKVETRKLSASHREPLLSTDAERIAEAIETTALVHL